MFRQALGALNMQVHFEAVVVLAPALPADETDEMSQLKNSCDFDK